MRHHRERGLFCRGCYRWLSGVPDDLYRPRLHRHRRCTSPPRIRRSLLSLQVLLFVAAHDLVDVHVWLVDEAATHQKSLFIGANHGEVVILQSCRNHKSEPDQKRKNHKRTNLNEIRVAGSQAALGGLERPSANAEETSTRIQTLTYVIFTMWTVILILLPVEQYFTHLRSGERQLVWLRLKTSSCHLTHMR